MKILNDCINVFKYDDNPDRLVILHMDNLPKFVDIYTDEYGTSNAAARYVRIDEHTQQIASELGISAQDLKDIDTFRENNIYDFKQ